ncbi:Indole-3-acetic acid-amido synthetase GH3.10 [Cocos nucifera]|uniref:Indole-3-acetic acid-amido synthetase GH3.10 n=1 Tax=Cocos nucifera TaxID=13894 RepID=A0A8K0N3J7_COCNU|nr:Indole-3-acetic acid-amido synthetase GH3.10 [Cocos nucifera]
MTVGGVAAASGDQEIIAWFEGVAENAGLVQRQTLRRIIELNHSTEYLQKWLGRDLRVQDLDPVALESLFTSSVPLATHADHEPYIQRIADGDTSPLLTQEPITMLSLRLVPIVPVTSYNGTLKYLVCYSPPNELHRLFPVRAGGRILEFIYSSKQFQTKGGLTVGTATTHYFASEEFKTRQQSTESFVCSPHEVIAGGDYNQSTYCHLLLGLAFCDQVDVIASTFAYSIVQAFTSFEELWEELCEDLREGTLGTKITSPKMRRAVMDCLTPNPSLASKIEKKCRELEESNWSNLIPKLWPNVKYIYSIMTGSMQPYLRQLRRYAGDSALVCADYGSTESWIGVNLEPSDPPETVTFTVIPSFSYFEFIPLYTRKEQDHSSSVVTDDFVEGEPLPLSQVKVGQQYEVVLTTFTGLYRYRLGDVVEVAGFYRGAPKLTFICRRKLILTVNIDKNTERDLQIVVEKGSSLLSQTRAELVDFTSHADLAVHPGHYVIYWEIRGKADDSVLNLCSREMDAAFTDHGYVVSRKTGSIGPLELRIVESGTFRRILDYCIGNGAALSQFKTPRCTTNQVLLRILDRCTVKIFWSTAYG